MKDNWHNPDFAVQWDQTALVGNPTRAEQLDILVSLLADTYREGTALLDLGMGSGLVEAQLFACRPDAYVVGVESSQAMIDLAKLRLAPFQRQYRLLHYDFSDFQQVVLPPETYHIIFSVQAFHHLLPERQQALYHSLFTILPPNGIFLLLDRIALDVEPFSALYRSLWDRLERETRVKSGLSGDDFLRRLQHKEEHPASLEEQLAWLRRAGFDATCLHLHLNRALLAGIKKK